MAIQAASTDRSGFRLHCFAVLTTIVMLPLIFVGGLVTSHGAALAVPDWPTSYGYNMFLFPWHKMVGGIFYEHSHRLIASLVGFMTIILTVWLYIKESRQWVRQLGLIALALVIFQGVLGGLRVLLLKQYIAIFHACLAQSFFCLLAAIALFTSRWWKERERVQSQQNEVQDKKVTIGGRPLHSPPCQGGVGGGVALRRWTLWTTALIFIQLILGATMRHTDSGLAVPDFPLIYDGVLPPLDSVTLEQINQQRIWQWNLEPVGFLQIAIHLMHRIWALAVAFGVLRTFWIVWRRYRDRRALKIPVMLLAALLAVQISLGIFVVWSGKEADVTTAHVAVGALTLVVSFLLTLVAFKIASKKHLVHKSGRLLGSQSASKTVCSFEQARFEPHCFLRCCSAPHHHFQCKYVWPAPGGSPSVRVPFA